MGSSPKLRFKKLQAYYLAFSGAALGQLLASAITSKGQPSNSCVVEEIHDGNVTNALGEFYRIWSFVLYENCIQCWGGALAIASCKNTGSKAESHNKGRELARFRGDRFPRLFLLIPLLPRHINLNSVRLAEKRRRHRQFI